MPNPNPNPNPNPTLKLKLTLSGPISRPFYPYTPTPNLQQDVEHEDDVDEDVDLPQQCDLVAHLHRRHHGRVPVSGLGRRSSVSGRPLEG